MNQSREDARFPVALQRCYEFVGRTTNWLYDHLRCVPRYDPVVLCDVLARRTEFPELTARPLGPESLGRRAWRRLTGGSVYPSDSWWLHRQHPRILHSHFGDQALADHALREHLGVPWVVGFYGADVYAQPQDLRIRRVYDKTFHFVSRALALGPAMAAQLEQLGCPRTKIAIHPLGVDVTGLPNRVRARERTQPLKVLFAGTFREKKGLPYVIDAVAVTIKRGLPIELHIVGDAAGKPGDREVKEAVFQQILARNIQDRTIHHSYLPFTELVNLALTCHVFVAPSVTAADGDAEGTPFVLQQMMATGMPAVATLHSDTPFLFGPHQDLLVPERDATAIADRLQLYVDDPDRLASDGARLRGRILAALDVRWCSARLADIYDEVLGVISSPSAPRPTPAAHAT